MIIKKNIRLVLCDNYNTRFSLIVRAHLFRVWWNSRQKLACTLHSRRSHTRPTLFSHQRSLRHSRKCVFVFAQCFTSGQFVCTPIQLSLRRAHHLIYAIQSTVVLASLLECVVYKFWKRAQSRVGAFLHVFFRWLITLVVESGCPNCQLARRAQMQYRNRACAHDISELDIGPRII